MNINEFNKTSPNTTWVENLALEEINMEDSGIVHMNDHLNPETILEESSIKFIGSLRDHFEYFSTKFNELRSNSNIKIFKISGTVNDFMLFRNSLRLVVTRKSIDILSISFINNAKEVFSSRDNKQKTTIENGHQIRAHLGPFNKVTWLYHGESVDTQALVKHYLSEFIRMSAT